MKRRIFSRNSSRVGSGRSAASGNRKRQQCGWRTEDHPFGRIGEIGEIGIIARVLHIEIDFHIDQDGQHIERLAFDRNAELRADGAAAAVAGEKIEPSTSRAPSGVSKVATTPSSVCRNVVSLWLQMGVAGIFRFEPVMQNRLEVMLRHVDDERIARLIGQQIDADGRPCGVCRALDIADLVDAQRFGQNRRRQRRSGGRPRSCG